MAVSLYCSWSLSGPDAAPTRWCASSPLPQRTMGAGASAHEVLNKSGAELAELAETDHNFGERASEIAAAVRKESISGEEFVGMSVEALEKRCRAADLDSEVIASLKERLQVLQKGGRVRAGTF